MTPETFTADYDFAAEELAYDPLADDDFDEDIDEIDTGNPPQPAALAAAAAKATPKPVRVDNRPPAERIEALFKEVAQRRRILLGLMAFVQTQRSAESLVDEVNRLQEYDASVYTSANFATMLENAGAIKKLNADGTDFDDTFEQEPDVVEIDGVEYLKPTDGKRVFWIITEAGQAYLDADRPIDRLNALLDRETLYAPIYKRVLTLCCDEGGHAIAEIAARVDKDPLVQEPRYYASNFVHKLEQCEAVCWEDCWKTTAVGLQGLERLADVVDDGPFGLDNKDGE